MAEKYDVLAQKSAPLSSALGTDMPVIPTRKDGSPDYIAGYKAYKEPMLKETKRLLEEQGAFEGLQREEETRQKGMLATGKAENLRKLKSDIEESQTAKDLTTLEDQYMHAAFVPTQATMGEMAAMFSLFGVAGMLIGAGGKGNSQAAMAAMSGMMKGYREGNEDLYKKEKATFDENLKVMGQRKDVLSKRLEQIAKLATMDKDAADQDLDALLAEQGADFYKKYKDKFGIAKLLELDKEVNKTHDKIYDLAIKEDERVRDEARRRAEKLADEQRRKEDKIEAEKRALRDREEFARYAAGLKASGEGGTQKATQQMFIVQRAVNALGGVASAVESLGQLPSGTTQGILPNLQTKDGMFNYMRNAAGRTMSSSESKAVETLFTGITRNLAAIEASGAATGLVGLATQIEKLRPVAGDKAVDVALKMADIRRIATENIQPLIDSGLMPKQQAEVANKLVKRIERAIPYTTQEVVDAAYGRKGKQTITQAGEAVIEKGRLNEAQQKRMRELEEKERAAK